MKIGIKKILALALAALMLFSLTACATGAASVDDATGSYGSFSWSYVKDTKTLTINGVGDMNNATSAAEVGWSAVRTGVEAVVIANTVTSIGDYAFYYMPALKSITLHEGITYIGKQAFAFCTSLETVILPEGVTTVGDSAFEGCSALTLAKLPASLTALGERAFLSCGKLETVQILGTVSELGDRVFANCKSLENLLIRPEVKALTPAATAFENCKLTGLEAAKETTSNDGSSVITIKYVDQSGNELAPTKELKLALGATYSEVSPVLEGYKCDSLTVTGTASGSDETVTVTYIAEKVEPETVESDTTAEDEGEGFGATDLVAIIIFAVVIIGIGVFAFILIRSDKKNAGKSQTVRKNDPKNKK